MSALRTTYIIMIISMALIKCQKQNVIYSDEFAEFGNHDYGVCLNTIPEKETILYIINSVNDYDNFKENLYLNEISDWPDIDFSESTIISIIMKTPVTCSEIIKQYLNWDSQKNRYSYAIDMSSEGYTAFGGYVSWIVVNESLPEDIDIALDINFIKP